MERERFARITGYGAAVPFAGALGPALGSTNPIGAGMLGASAAYGGGALDMQQNAYGQAEDMAYATGQHQNMGGKLYKRPGR